MQAKTIQGIPFLLNTTTQQIYAYEKPVSSQPLLLGTYHPETETYTLLENWRELYEPRLNLYRESEKIRSRIPVALKH
jgi:hypothetical protein